MARLCCRTRSHSVGHGEVAWLVAVVPAVHSLQEEAEPGLSLYTAFPVVVLGRDDRDDPDDAPENHCSHVLAECRTWPVAVCVLLVAIPAGAA